MMITITDILKWIKMKQSYSVSSDNIMQPFFFVCFFLQPWLPPGSCILTLITQNQDTHTIMNLTDTVIAFIFLIFFLRSKNQMLYHVNTN